MQPSPQTAPSEPTVIPFSQAADVLARLHSEKRRMLETASRNCTLAEVERAAIYGEFERQIPVIDIALDVLRQRRTTRSEG